MSYYMAIAVGGAFGAMGRYWLTGLAEHHNSSVFPVGTLTVNVIGSLLLGVLFVLTTEKMPAATYLRPLFAIGFLGALTTFSTFSVDALVLLQQGFYATAVTYIVASVVICLLAAWMGMSLTSLLL
jgi:CrcB protein